MRFIELVKKRRSVRKYTQEPLKERDILTCVEAARLAPSATNSQPWHFYYVEDEETIKEIAKSTVNPAMKFNKFTLNAKGLMIVTTKKGNVSSKIGQTVTGLPYYLIDVGIAVEHFCLQATELGIGTCIVGWFNQKKIRKTISLPTNQRVALLVALGYPQDNATKGKKRNLIEDIYTKVV